MAALRHANVHGDNLIACRICDLVFLSSKALFDHIENHLLLDESAAKRLLLLSHFSLTSHPPPPTRQQDWQQPRLSSTLLRNGYDPSTLPPRERNPFFIGANARNLYQQSTVRPPPVSFRSKGNKSLSTLPELLSAAAASPQIMTVPQSRIDLFTRPFLNQLEATLLIDGMASIIDREIDGKLGDQTLDVTLKL